MRLRHLALLLTLLAACASDDDGAPTPAPVVSDMDLDFPPTDATEGGPPKFDPATLAGKTYLIEINADTARATCTSPPTDPLICSQWPGLMSTVAVRIALKFEAMARGELAVYAGSLDDRLQSNARLRKMSSLNFTQDGNVDILFENLDLNVNEERWTAIKLTIEAAVLSEQGSFNLSRLRFNFSPDWLNVEIGICNFVECEPDGTVLLELHNITARLAPEIDFMDCSNPVDKYALEGIAWEWALDADVMVQHCASPPTHALVCGDLAAFTEGPVTIRHQIIFTGKGQAVLSLRTDAPDINQQGFLSEPTDFDNNPCLTAIFGPMWMDWGGDIEPTMKRALISASVSPDLSRLDLATVDLYLDVRSMDPFPDGVNVCSLVPCEPDGTLRVQLEGITARRVGVSE